MGYGIAPNTEAESMKTQIMRAPLMTQKQRNSKRREEEKQVKVPVIVKQLMNTDIKENINTKVKHIEKEENTEREDRTLKVVPVSGPNGTQLNF